MKTNPKVGQFLKEKKHPLTQEIQKIREIILSTDDKIEEVIKWSSPTFIYKGNMASFMMNAKKHITLMFHEGVKLENKSGLLEGDGKKSRAAKFTNMEDIDNKKDNLQTLVNEWILFKDNI